METIFAIALILVFITFILFMFGPMLYRRIRGGYWVKYYAGVIRDMPVSGGWIRYESREDSLKGDNYNIEFIEDYTK